MARKAKYLELEIAEMQQQSSYKKRLEEYAFSKKVNDASHAEVIKMIFRREIKNTYCFYSGDAYSKSWSALISQISNTKHSQDYENRLCSLLTHIADISDTFFIEESNMKMMFTIIQMYDEFLRPIEEWVPKSRNRFKQAFELLRHLFAKYDVPEFLDKGFAKGELESISLFTIIGAGKSFKDFELAPKIVLNKKIYHHLFSTPENYNFFEAFRRAQILSNGGSEILATNILGTSLKSIQRDEEFWFTVIQFFINQPMFDNDQVGPIIDYIKNKKYQSRVENGVTLPPEQPDFSIKGRTIQALLRQTEEWHERLAEEARINNQIARQNRAQNRYSYTPKPAPVSWQKVRIPHMDYKSSKEKRYMIIQYGSTAELMQEGSDMKHCVGSYAYNCSTGKTSIWSLRLLEKGDTKKLLTIEVNNATLQIVQIRGKSNRRADVSEMNIVRKWAMDAGLNLSSYV